jgi:ribosomal-protein-alanine N-acetyltransferase
MEVAVIRQYEEKDLKDVLKIENVSFSDPWSKTMFESLAQLNPKGLYVIEKNSRVIGYAIILVEPYFVGVLPNKRAHLINLAIHPDFRNRGFGSKLVETIITDMKKARTHSVFLEVRKSNSEALEFYSSLLFQRIGLIKRFYLNEDAIVMSKTISQ